MRLYKIFFGLFTVTALAAPAQSAVDFYKVFSSVQNRIESYLGDEMPDDLRKKLIEGFVRQEN